MWRKKCVLSIAGGFFSFLFLFSAPKARGQAAKGHELDGCSELGSEAARERNSAAVLEEIARKLRGREGTAATD